MYKDQPKWPFLDVLLSLHAFQMPQHYAKLHNGISNSVVNHLTLLWYKETLMKIPWKMLSGLVKQGMQLIPLNLLILP